MGAEIEGEGHVVECFRIKNINICENHLSHGIKIKERNRVTLLLL